MSPTSFGPYRILSLAALALAGVSAQAQVVISLNVTPTASLIGYNTGSNYTFSFTTGTSFGANGWSNFSPIINYYGEELTTEDQLFTSVSGDGLIGSFVRPVTTLDDPYSGLGFFETDELGPFTNAFVVRADADDTNIGLTTAVGNVVVNSVNVHIPDSTINVAYPGVYTQPNSLLEAVAGTYFPPVGTLTLSTGEGPINFNVNSFTIDPPAVEVPFGVDSTTGLALLGLASAWKLRRRNRS